MEINMEHQMEASTLFPVQGRFKTDIYYLVRVQYAGY